MCIGDDITNEELKLEVESLRKENAALKAELAKQTTNTIRDSICFLEKYRNGLIWRLCARRFR